MRKSTRNTGRNLFALRSAFLFLIALMGYGSAMGQGCTLACNDLVQFSLDNDCNSEVLADHLLEAPNSCPGPKTVMVIGANGQPIPGSPWVNGSYIGQTLTVKVTHNATGNHCWGAIYVEDKMPPVLFCENVEVYCGELGLSPAEIGFPAVEENCDPNVQLTWNDQITNFNCATGPYAARITRSWLATDKYGNTGNCVQQINFLRATISDVAFPLNRDDVALPALLCGNPNTAPANTGWPTVGGKPIGGFCDLVATYSDQSSSMCQGNQTIFRTWTVMDMCSGAVSSQMQIIKVLDKAGPTITPMSNPAQQVQILSYLTGSQHNGCMAVVRFPQLQISDNCSSYSHLKFTVSAEINGFNYSVPSNGGILTVPLGNHTFIYKATDDCGNFSTYSFTFDVQDKVPPVVACETFHTVALATDVTHINAITFDDGSYDACSGITFQVRRADNPKCPGNDATQLAPTVPFYCCDINNGPVMITLRVTDLFGNWNECMTLVEVVDKVAPSIWCPKDVTVNCGAAYEPVDPLTYTATVTPNMNISSAFANTYKVPVDISGLPADAEIQDLDIYLDIQHEYLDQLKISLISPKGSKVRLFDGGACGIGKEDILVTFNDEGAAFNCSGSAPSIKGNIKPQADLLSFFDGEGINSTGSGANKKTWVLEVEDTAPIAGGRINEVRLLFTYATPLGLRPVVHDNTEACGLTVTWKDLDAVDKCPNSFIRRQWSVKDLSNLTKTCEQRIYFNDTTPWEVEFPVDVTIADCIDLNDLNNLGNVKHNGDCEMVGLDYQDKVFTVVPDACYKIERTWTVINWCTYNKMGNNTKLGIPVPGKPRTWIDNGDGYFEYTQTIKVMDNTAPKLFCPSDVTIQNMEANCGPTLVEFPDLIVVDCSPNIKGTITIDLFNNGTIDQTKSGINATGTFPNGVHRIHFSVTDGCNNTSTCSLLLTVVDGKKPQASCIDINIDLMAMNGGGMAQITPSMINHHSSDNCTPAHKLLLHVAPNVFTCDELGPNEVTLTVTDENGNQDMCIAIVNVQDNMKVCPNSLNGAISGYVKDNNAEAVEAVNVEVTNANGMAMTTGNTGFFQFTGLNAGQGYIVQPVKDDNHLNGVSTYDILLIQKHLLGIKTLNSPYKLIAADVNKSDNLSISDIIDLRKALLSAGAFAKNTSWRFVESDYVFINPANPFAEQWPEYTEIKSMPESGINTNFTGIKIGDVSGDATPHSLLGGEVRNLAGTLTFEVQDARLEEGQIFAMPVRSRDLSGIEGFQFTLGFDQQFLQFAGIEPGKLPALNGDNFGMAFADQGFLTASWNGKTDGVQEDDVLFTIRFFVKQANQLREVVQINSMYLTAEAYDAQDNLLDAQLRIAGEEGSVSNANGYALYQNRPNPFRNETIIGFELPASGRATLTLTDISGKVLRVYQGDFARGYNEFRVLRNEVQTNGVVYYRLTSDGFAATRKMIIIE